MKLVIQIPCFNEEKTLPAVMESMPKTVEGVDQVEYQIIDDGSTDRTIEVARELGIQHIIRVPGKNRRWLGRAFRLGVDAALKRGADIIVNTDGDNQYPASRIADLVQPILSGQADICIGDRRPGEFHEFSWLKRKLQSLGNLVVSWVAGEKVYDAVSGFRAYSRRAALRIHVMTNFTYTVDTLIQAYKKGLDVVWIPITPNPKTRDSRLIKNIWSKVAKSGATILRVTVAYEPFKLFLALSIFFSVPGAFYILRFLYIYVFQRSEAAGHIQSVVLGGVCLVIAIQMLAVGILAELLTVNRQLNEEILSRMKGM